MRAPLHGSILALVAWAGLAVHVGASACGALECGLMTGPGCCASASEDEPPAHDTARRGPCGCCEVEALACSTVNPPPAHTAAGFELPDSAAAARTVVRVLDRLDGDRRATVPRTARPPPRPVPTATVVLIC